MAELVYDSIHNVGDFLSTHWLSEVFPARLKTLQADWTSRAEHGKPTPWRGLLQASTPFARAKRDLPERLNGRLEGQFGNGNGAIEAVQGMHDVLLTAMGFEPRREALVTDHAGQEVAVPLAARCRTATGEALHVLEARPAASEDELLDPGAAGVLLDPLTVRQGQATDRVERVREAADALSLLFLSEGAPRYALLLAGGWVLLTDRARWSEGRYLAFDADTALARRDERKTGELAWHAGLWSADVLLPRDDVASALDEFSADSVKHAVGVSKELREGLRVSVELVAGEVILERRKRGLPVEDLPDLPRQVVRESLRFLYRILFLLYAEARPELGILPANAPEYGAGYGLDRLRELALVPLETPHARDGHHIHDSLKVLFRLVNEGHRPRGAGEAAGTDDGLRFEPLRSDLFHPAKAPLIDQIDLHNEVLQRILQLLLLSKERKGRDRGYVSYAQLGINQLGAVYEGLMAYSGFFAGEDLLEVARDGDPSKGTWIVPVRKAGEYDQRNFVRREDPVTGESVGVRHPKGSFVYRLSGRDRQRSASYYTPEVLTRCVVKHALGELLDQDGSRTPARRILELTVCEPALGSGAFLNEAINQLAHEYLERRQEELGITIAPDDFNGELQKVKAHLALHQCYGVDLNQTAVELAEVSLWLNVMHPGLQGPWFGLHLRRGNSLIGARRATYDLAGFAKAKLKWLRTSPEDRPLSAGTIGTGDIHHFLLPAHGWGAVGDAQKAKELAPEAAKALRGWRREVSKNPTPAQRKRLLGLARRVERLWRLAQRRLEISEREVARHIDVWQAEQQVESAGAVTREQVESALHDPESPYQRLRLVMDAWCALWFWPLDAGVNPPGLEEWIATLTHLIGVEPEHGRKHVAGQLSLVDHVRTFAEMDDADRADLAFHNAKRVTETAIDHPWLGIVHEIADREGFFHWELDFAHIFARGGFDLQVGNPPWVRPVWEDDMVLAEFDPWFGLETSAVPVFNARRGEVLSEPGKAAAYLREVASEAGLNESLGSPVVWPLLTGIQTNLYMVFMDSTWRHCAPAGAVGLIHQESPFSDPKAGKFRREIYRRSRRHFQFFNDLLLFEDVDNNRPFGVHIYGAAREIAFLLMSDLKHPDTIDGSLAHDGSSELPGIQYPQGGWDLRPHRGRVLHVDEHVLASWVRLFDTPGTPPAEARLMRAITTADLQAIDVIANQDTRLADHEYHWARCFDEDKAKRDGILSRETRTPRSWEEVVLQGPHFTVATPLAKQPNENCKSNKDYTSWDLERLPEAIVPRTNYQRASDRERYEAAITHWTGVSSSAFWRLIWRRRTDPGTERSLHVAMIFPGPAHVHTVHSLTGPDRRSTTVWSGLWSTLPFDYLVRIAGKADLQDELVRRFPAPRESPYFISLLLRTLRLNCLTREYAPLWEELYDSAWQHDRWTGPDSTRPPLGEVRPEWTMETPLRTGYDRRMALVELDALAALILGLTAEQLCAMYRTQFAVLRKYEYKMWFDANGRRVPAEVIKDWQDDPDRADLGHYRLPFMQPDRQKEMTRAYEQFKHRLDQGELR